MTPGDLTKPDDEREAGDVASPSPAAESLKPKSDLRFTAHQQGGVSVDRDMSGQGHLARGSHTNMSNLRFSVKAQPRKELDPELLALRDASEPVSDRASPREALPPAPVAAAEPAVVPPAEATGLLAAMKRLFS